MIAIYSFAGSLAVLVLLLLLKMFELRRERRIADGLRTRLDAFFERRIIAVRDRVDRLRNVSIERWLTALFHHAVAGALRMLHSAERMLTSALHRVAARRLPAPDGLRQVGGNPELPQSAGPAGRRSRLQDFSRSIISRRVPVQALDEPAPPPDITESEEETR